MATVNGGPGSESLDGTIDNDTITAGAGNDTVTGGAGDDLIDAGTGDDLVYGDGAGSGAAGELGDGPGSTGGGYDRISGQPVSDGNHSYSTDAFFLGDDIPILDGADRRALDGVSFSQDGDGTDRTFGLDELQFTGAQRSFVGLVTSQRTSVSGANDQFTSSTSGGFQDLDVVNAGTVDFTMNDGQVFENIRMNFLRGPDGDTFMVPSDAPSPGAFNAFKAMLTQNDSGIASFEISSISDNQNGISNIEGNWADGQFAPTETGEDGDDTILGGDGADTIYGEGGNDLIDGGTGDDIIYGDSDNSPSAGGSGTGLGDGPGLTGGSYERVVGRPEFETFDFTTDAFFLGNDIVPLDFPDPNDPANPDFRALDGQTFSQDGVGTDRTFGLEELSFENGSQSYVGVISIERSDLYGSNSSFSSSLADGPQDLVIINNGIVNFTMNDGTEFPSIQMKFVRDEEGNTFMVPGDGASPDAFNSFRNLLATNDSGIKSFEINSISDGTNGIMVMGGDWADGQFAPTTDGEGGNDTITGGEGADQMFGEGGNDTFIVGSASEGAGDVISGGNGPDENTDNDVLDLRGAGQVTITATTDANDAGAQTGTVTFADGSTLTFEGIETILTDPPEVVPVAVDDAVTIDEDSGPVSIDVLANDTDPNGDTLTVVSATVPADQGTVGIVDNQVVFTPAPNFNGDATISYTVEDPDGNQSSAEVAVTITPVEDAPVTVGDTASTDEDTPVTIDPLANDSDSDGQPLAISGTPTSPNGTVTVNPDGTIEFTPDPDFNGPTTIDYIAVDPDGNETPGQITVDVAAVNDAPVVVDDRAETDFGTPVTIDVLGNDSDAENDPLTITEATVPIEQGTVAVVDGQLLFTPAPGFEGEATISYTVTDGELTGTAQAVVTVGDNPADGVVDGAEEGEVMAPGYVDPQGDEIDGADGLDDIIEAKGGDDDVDAGLGDDVVSGGTGNDTINGNVGNDTLSGDEGDDLLIGGAGADEMSGGLGDDLFVIDTPGDGAGDVIVGGEDPDGLDNDVLDLTGSDISSIVFDTEDPTYDPETGISESGLVTFADGGTLSFSEIETVIPCFTPGTLIATSKGERLVEELQPGDLIITRDNGFQEIAWVGAKKMSAFDLAQRPNLRPVFVAAGSLGQGLPERDMMLSPNHKVLFASDLNELHFEDREVLVAAKHLIGMPGIRQVEVTQTTYIHFMFERHEVVLSEGAWTESFHPGDFSLNGMDHGARNEILTLFPELATDQGLSDYQLARTELKKHEARLMIG